MFMYVCMYICMCACMHVCMHALPKIISKPCLCIHTYNIYIYIYVCVCVCVCVCMCIYIYFKNTKNLFIHIAHYPVRRFLRDIPTFLKCPLQSLVGAGVGSDRYQCDSAHETQPTRHCLLSRYRVWMCCSIALASTSPFAYFTYIS